MKIVLDSFSAVKNGVKSAEKLTSVYKVTARLTQTVVQTLTVEKYVYKVDKKH